ncbi:MAG: hypothetical protein WC702_01920 [Patescibacteria group bacterium]|jgi:hypothetical protein
MFEDIKQPPDIFAETDKPEDVPPPFRPPQRPVATPSVPPLVSAPTPMPPQTAPVINHSSGWKPIIIIMGAVIVIAVGAWLSTMILGSREPVTESLTNIANNAAVEQTTNVEEEETLVEEVVPETVVEVDTDKDGLTDAREAELGTSAQKTDTDDDGLFDREEVDVYKTDPLNPDTDGDSYLDGAEVKSGYNPNGAGKLFELPGNN